MKLGRRIGSRVEKRKGKVRGRRRLANHPKESRKRGSTSNRLDHHFNQRTSSGSGGTRNLKKLIVNTSPWVL